MILFHLTLTAPILLCFVLWAWVMVFPVVVIQVPRLHLEARGLALPGFILATPYLGEAGLRHEMAHQKQYRKWSPLGVAAFLGWHYGKGYLQGYLRHKRWPSFWSLWQTNPLEIEANAAMEAGQPIPRHVRWTR